MEIEVDFSQVPSDVGLLVAQNKAVDQLAALLIQSLDLTDTADRQLIRDELIGEVADLVDRYTGVRT